MLPPKAYTYLLIDLESAPDTLALMLSNVTNPSVYDTRPDPDRFTLREMFAHLADWDEIFLGRMTQTRDHDLPTLQGLDEGQVARDRNYAQADPVESLTRYKANRAEVIAFLRALTPDQLARVGSHTELGLITLADQAVLIAVHDGYHRRQTLDWLAAG